MSKKLEKIFHKAAGTAPSPFQIVRRNITTIGSSVKRKVQNISSKIMAPQVNVMKKHDEKMKEMERKAKAGEFN